MNPKLNDGAAPCSLFHVTTDRKAKLYRQTGRINSPVRGFVESLMTNDAPPAHCVWQHDSVTGSKRDQVKQIGNAVPCGLARAIVGAALAPCAAVKEAA